MSGKRVVATVLGALAMAFGATGLAAARSPLTGTWSARAGGASWRVTFTADNAYVAKATGVIRGTPMTFVAGAGRLTFAGSRVTFRDRRGCSGRQAIAVYTWRRTSSTLRFTPVREHCVNRRAVLTAVLRLVR